MGNSQKKEIKNCVKDDEHSMKLLLRGIPKDSINMRLKYMMKYMIKTEKEIFKFEEIKAFNIFDSKIESQDIKVILKNLENIFIFYKNEAKYFFLNHIENLEILIKKLNSTKKMQVMDNEQHVKAGYILLNVCVSRFKFKSSHLCKKQLTLYRQLQQIFFNLWIMEISQFSGGINIDKKYSEIELINLQEMRENYEKLSELEGRYSQYLILCQIILGFFETEELMNYFFKEHFVDQSVS